MNGYVRLGALSKQHLRPTMRPWLTDWECVYIREGVSLSPMAAGAYHDGEAVVSLDTVLVTLGFGVLAAAQLGVGGKVQVVVHNLTPLHEEQGRVLVQSTLLTQVACNLVGNLAGLQMEREGEEGWRRRCFEE